MSVRSLYEMFKKIRPNLLGFSFALFIFSWVLKYGAPGGYEEVVFWSNVSLGLAIFIILIGQPISIRINATMIGLWMFYNVYEFVLIVTGLHTAQVHQVITYLIDAGIYVLMAFSLTSFLAKKMDLVWISVQAGLTFSLGWMAFHFPSTLMTYVPDLFFGIFENSRIARVGIGFYNVNILGGLSGLLVFVSLLNAYKNRLRYSSIVTALFGGYLLLNSGTRSSILALAATLVFYVLLTFGAKYRSVLNLLLPGAFFVGEFIYALFMGTVHQTTGIARVASALTSKRSEFGRSAFELLDNTTKALFGTGMRIQGDIRGTFFTTWSGSSGLDGEPQWFVFTTGIIGGLVTLLVITFTMYKIGQKSTSGYLFMVYFGIMMTFEHVFFNSQSVSGATGLILTIMFIILIGNSDMNDFRRRDL